jgi:hypothetical protein
VPFAFSDNTKGTVGMVSSYVGMMCVGRRRLANTSFVTTGFAFLCAAGSVRFNRARSARFRLNDNAVDPLYCHLGDDDPPIDADDDWPPANYCGYYGSRWCEQLCLNDGSERLVKCAICEVRCCVEVCISSGTASRCRRCQPMNVQ